MIIPWIIVGPIAGVLADRISRKAIMVTADAVRGILTLIIPFTENIGTLKIIVFFIGVASASPLKTLETETIQSKNRLFVEEKKKGIETIS